ncbi:F0F1 ATP synthase subunit gamma [Elstera sp.]|jgi:F-type H+-transporting ATPase subunit gamma|uniref:F0F1 ATP synthase subunit gamma n=1 Tax=Elstera sp. TaxID=1916664 RepID=UPI0037BE75B2
MASLKDLRLRIRSVKSTQKITSAMKMVAAAKLRRAQEQAEAARPYAERMERMIATLGAGVSSDAPVLLTGTGSDKVQLVIVATADRGLCGAFNSSIIRDARLMIRGLQASGKTVKLYCVGRKGRDGLRKEFGDIIIDSMELAGKKKLSFADANAVALKVISLFDAGQIDSAHIIYARFRSAIAQIVTRQQLIPVPLPAVEAGAASGGASALYEYEPDEEAILAALLPRNLSVQIYKALLENSASEHGARMTAMDNATRNAGDMINRLTLTYNRSRQAQITKELIEIISGAEAV